MSKQPLLVTDSQQLARPLELLREQNGLLGLVPTMGALHEGHLSLVRRSVQQCQATIVTVFVNPAQFEDQQDLEKYQQHPARDLDLLEGEGVNLVFAPSEAEIYPEGFSDWVEPPAVATRWEGEQRPGHFRGVCTVLKQLFQRLPADIAYFGEKDYQQSVVTRQLVEKLAIPIQVEVCPTVREHDGLAMSSRNAYLSAAERLQATALWRCLQLAQQLVEGGETSSHRIIEKLTQLLESERFEVIDYVAIVDPQTLESREQVDGSLRLLVAARLGGTRLIDNSLLPMPGQLHEKPTQ
jgi:pantoate--beta-alanine ligase